MENRWSNVLRDHNELILDLSPAHGTLRAVLALELAKECREGQTVLDVGSGEGHSAMHILRHTSGRVDLLDVSHEMHARAKKRLYTYKQRLQYICADACEYLARSLAYDHIISQWTIHNFVQVDKSRLFRAIFAKLRPGGHFILMDKIYPPTDGECLFDVQMHRYRFLPKDVRDAVIAHERVDYSHDYRMDEVDTIATLKSVGFQGVEIIDRVERDAVLVARRPL